MATAMPPPMTAPVAPTQQAFGEREQFKYFLMVVLSLIFLCSLLLQTSLLLHAGLRRRQVGW
jgi:hypothetical protein